METLYAVNPFSFDAAPKYPTGNLYETPDKAYRFRYGPYSVASIQASEFLACNPLTNITGATAPAQATGAGVPGSNKVTMTVAASDGILRNGAVTVNALQNGVVVIGNGTGQHPQNRRILSNTAVAAGGGVTTLTLEFPLVTTAVGMNIETAFSPYASMQSMYTMGTYDTLYSVTLLGYVTAVGLPTVTVSAALAAAGAWGWVQTRGLAWMTSNNGTSNQADDRDIYVVENGSVVSGYDVTYASSHPLMFQRIGTAMDASSSGNSNGPFVDLQLE
jgi:hypothetical protein